MQGDSVLQGATHHVIGEQAARIQRRQLLRRATGGWMGAQVCGDNGRNLVVAAGAANRFAALRARCVGGLPRWARATQDKKGVRKCRVVMG